MDSIHEVKEALSARSRTATLDQLHNEGRQKVRIIRAEHIAEMISHAVQRTVMESGLISQDEVDDLVARSREEFKDVVREREEERLEMEQLRERLDRSRTEAEELRNAVERLGDGEEQLATVTAERDDLKSALGDAHARTDELAAEVAALQQALDQRQEPQAGSGGGGGVSTDLVMRLMEEVVQLKGRHGGADATPSAAGGPAALDTGALEAMVAQLSGALNDRLDKFGRKMGISSAVDASEVKFDSLFRDDDVAMESNMDDVTIKQKKGGGIGANLERLRKLKGGG